MLAHVRGTQSAAGKYYLVILIRSSAKRTAAANQCWASSSASVEINHHNIICVRYIERESVCSNEHVRYKYTFYLSFLLSQTNIVCSLSNTCLRNVQFHSIYYVCNIYVCVLFKTSTIRLPRLFDYNFPEVRSFIHIHKYMLILPYNIIYQCSHRPHTDMHIIRLYIYLL